MNDDIKKLIVEQAKRLGATGTPVFGRDGQLTWCRFMVGDMRCTHQGLSLEDLLERMIASPPWLKSDSLIEMFAGLRNATEQESR